MGIRELRDTLTAALRRVREGETIEITRDGDPFAVIAPLRQSRIERLLARGDVHPPKPLVRPIRTFPVTGELTAAEALADDRGD